MAARLDQNAFARIYKQNGNMGGRCSRNHIARVLLVPWCIGNDEVAAGRGEIAVSDVYGDALLTFSLQAISDMRRIEFKSIHRRKLAQRSQFIFVYSA